MQKLSDEQKQRIQKYRQECISETQVNPELIDKADKGDFTDDKNLKCFAKCFYKKAGFVNDKGELLLDVIKSKIPGDVDREKALAVIDKCKDRVGADTCETVFLVHKCYFESTRPEKIDKDKSNS